MRLSFYNDASMVESVRSLRFASPDNGILVSETRHGKDSTDGIVATYPSQS